MVHAYFTRDPLSVIETIFLSPCLRSFMLRVNEIGVSLVLQRSDLVQRTNFVLFAPRTLSTQSLLPQPQVGLNSFLALFAVFARHCLIYSSSPLPHRRPLFDERFGPLLGVFGLQHHALEIGLVTKSLL